jgi:hypothetical protein
MQQLSFFSPEAAVRDGIKTLSIVSYLSIKNSNWTLPWQVFVVILITISAHNHDAEITSSRGKNIAWLVFQMHHYIWSTRSILMYFSIAIICNRIYFDSLTGEIGTKDLVRLKPCDAWVLRITHYIDQNINAWRHNTNVLELKKSYSYCS